MPGDPKQCRLNALRCAELAQTAKAEQLKLTLLELSKNWVKLAVSLETTQALLDGEKQPQRASKSPLPRDTGDLPTRQAQPGPPSMLHPGGRTDLKR